MVTRLPVVSGVVVAVVVVVVVVVQGGLPKMSDLGVKKVILGRVIYPAGLEIEF